jgi:D-tyrosyl-tRNA(Tyr) deacylase
MMKIVVQRTLEASVLVENKQISSIQKGFLLLVAIEKDDTISDREWCAKKVSGLRVFEDENNKLNLNIHQVKGKILSVSQFTLAGNVEKGNRPSFTKAQTQELAKQQFDEFNNMLRAHGCHVEEGQFQADMKVQLTNEGPVTLIIESNGRK